MLGIDPHVHMESTLLGALSNDDFYTGTRAALSGGTTTIIEYVWCKCKRIFSFATPSFNGSLIEAYEQRRRIADGKVCADYAMHMSIVNWNPRVAKEMQQVIEEKGINSFKLFLSFVLPQFC